MPEPRLIDGRGMLPPEPLERAMAALDTLPSGGELVMLLHGEPLPLYAMLDRRGFRYHAVDCADGSRKIHITKP